jgi:chorismate synthase
MISIYYINWQQIQPSTVESVGEAMMACVLADHFLRHRAQVGG